MSYGMWLLSTGVDAYFARQALPDQYTAHSITVTVRTVTLGLAYLATFIFGVNAIGLFGAHLQGLTVASVNCDARTRCQVILHAGNLL